MRTADLHLHTNASDGVLPPKVIIDQAARAGLSYIAITDHDTIDAFDQIEQLPAELTLIRGIEFSCDCQGEEIHLLAYLDRIDHPELVCAVRHISYTRQHRLEQMLHRLEQLGYPVNIHDLQRAVKDASSWGRPHLAQVMVEKGYCSSVADAFDKLLSSRGPVFVPREKPAYTDIIRLVDRIGGITVLAHPGIIRKASTITAALEAGIDGIEVYHPKNDPHITQQLYQLAEQHHLLITGGSDFHGIRGRYPEQLGEWTVEAEYAQRLIQALQNRAQH